jgi:pyruvate dehydrogenase (quinone)
VQIDVDGRMLSLRYPMEVALKGDARDTLRALMPLLVHKPERAWQDGIIEGMRAWRDLCERRAMEDVEPGRVNPERLFHELSKQLPDACVLSADSGTAANWYGRDLMIRRGMMASGSGNLATMGPAVPYAIAAKFCLPDRVAIALTGDGAMQMNGINCMITVAKYWKEWSDPRWICLVLNNSDLNQVTWEQRVMGGDVKFTDSQALPAMSYAAFADMLGLRGIRVDHPDAIAGAWREALSADRPVIIDAMCSADVPTIPPHITLEQAKNFAKSLMMGDPEREGVIKHMVRDVVETFAPHR